MSEEATFFLPVKDHCRHTLITCNIEDTVMVAAEIMRNNGVSSLIACDDIKQPIGILTDRDLRNKVIAGGLSPLQTKVSKVMTTPVISVAEDDTLFEVLYRMSSNRIHRVGVVDADNVLIGLINESDIIRLQNRSPQRLLQSVDEAQSVADLKKIYHENEQLVIFLRNNGVRTNDLVKMISLLNDQIAIKLINLLKQGRFETMGTKSTFMVLGSEGRQEQTLKTDQDNAMIIADDASAAEIADIEAFSYVLIDALIEIGVPECPGGIMARNEFWRRSLADWKSVISDWVGTPSGENILNFSMFSDMRALCGDRSLERELKEYIIHTAEENSLFLARMAQNVCRFSPPLGFFGQIKTESSGTHLGSLDLKKAGIFALTEGVKILALRGGMLGGSTHERLAFLQKKDILSQEQVSDIEASFNLLTFLRLRGQVESAAAGHEISNYISPSSLNRVEKGRLKLALDVVKSFQGILGQQFQLNMLRN
ncbi:MAG: putative nucleotidyltransferase substrate binding domain-containing protein [Thermodesulfobacteriota bacterium]|nr:putative nucleotidyltransferase substrate binding domain-containing protein [Thermodesulfobacteriota bacterium]